MSKEIKHTFSDIIPIRIWDLKVRDNDAPTLRFALRMLLSYLIP